MKLAQFWDDLSIWNKYGLCAVGAVVLLLLILLFFS